MSYLRCPRCNERIEVFGASHAAAEARQLGVALLGQLPLDPELARHCDSGQVEAYPAELFQEIADTIEAGVPAMRSRPTP